MFRALNDKLSNKYAKVLILVLFILLSLRVLTWFQYPNILASGDLRPPFNSQAFLKSAFTTWDEIDFGMPSVYSPRLLDPFYILISAFETLGVGLFWAEMTTIFLIYFFSTSLFYFFVKQLTDDRIVALVAALFFTANVYLVNDREVTAVGFPDFALMILPFLIAFTMGLRRSSPKFMAVAGVLGVLMFASFPNYRTVFIGLSIAALVAVYFFFKSQSMTAHHDKLSLRTSFQLSLNWKQISHYVKLLGVFVLAFLLASLWILILVFSNFSVLMATYNQMSQSWGFTGGLSLFNVTRLVTKWGFYSGALGMPYIPYRNMYLNVPGFIAISFLPAAMAFASLFLSRKRKATVFFGIVAVVSLLFCSGLSFNSYGTQLYMDLTGLFFLKAFREASNWIFFLVLSFSILIGYTISALSGKFRRKTFKVLLIGLVAALFLSTSYPLVTGDVGRNYLAPNVKGTYVPASYSELNNMLSNQNWAIIVGQRFTYTLYNFSQAPFGCGNPYPLIFSNPFVSGVGSEYVQSSNIELINKIQQVLIGNVNIAREGKVSASSIEDARYLPSYAVDGNMLTRWSSNRSVPQWIDVDWGANRQISGVALVFEAAYAQDYSIQTFANGKWTTQAETVNNTQTQINYTFANPINSTGLRVVFTKATDLFGSVSLYELEIYTRTLVAPRFLDALGIGQLIVEKDLVLGGTTYPEDFSLSDDENLLLAKDWNEVALYNTTHDMSRLYVANNTVGYVSLDDMCNAAENTDWRTIEQSVFLNSTSTPQLMGNTLFLPSNFSWKEISSTTYEANLQTTGPFFLVFLQSYDPNWKLYVNGKLVPEAMHVQANAYANAWLVESSGVISLSLEYEPENFLRLGIAASIILSAVFLVFLGRKELERYVRSSRRRLALEATHCSRVKRLLFTR